ncbi:hemolysin-III related-domain-containing protein [Lipomyces japonicus]|uniref:hemolysin-III related-domain-containing protein n=1 Tax=Lipomyces japonicus TaxID=56871 RepID=UPI0034CE90F1
MAVAESPICSFATSTSASSHAASDHHQRNLSATVTITATTTTTTTTTAASSASTASSSPSGKHHHYTHHHGPSYSSISLSQVTAAKGIVTVLWDELPAWRQDNHFITSGYRRETFSFRQCASSLLYLHNESVNIYSHLIGSLFFLIVLGITLNIFLPRYDSTSASDFVVFVIFFIGAVLCLGMSSTYHCLNCHSESVAKFGNRLDYLGIIFLIIGSFVPAIFYGLHPIPHYMPIFLALVCGLGTICTVLTLRHEFALPKWRPFRALMFVVFGLSGVIPMTFAGFKYGFHELVDRTELPLLITEGGLYIAGAAIYAARVPERFKPGKFDIFGSSHQIFHVCVVTAAVFHLVAIIGAYKFCHGQRAGF